MQQMIAYYFSLSQVKYYYDSAAQMCLQFFWGGCGGNANRFETYEQCKVACEPRMQVIRENVRRIK